mmetsp:Transcript_17505/g.27323  ORF Transcript_17505/g.27323 Transcript_17505/m.27323 type:complete len:275 (+) Transcript_17505:2-826(+)
MNCVVRARNAVIASGSAVGLNVVAFSGGVDSSVVGALLKDCFPLNSVGVIGVSKSLPRKQLELARKVAEEDIGLDLLEIETVEGKKREYVDNVGESCYHCKVSLYECSIEAVGNIFPRDGIRLFNGTNLDDVGDKTRVGLKAASEFRVASPLETLTKSEVREVARWYGLRTASYAASPCLRSRLEFGVRAVEEHLALVESAEEKVRELVEFGKGDDLRFRMLGSGRYRVEVGESKVGLVLGVRSELGKRLGLESDKIDVGLFRSGGAARFRDAA